MMMTNFKILNNGKTNTESNQIPPPAYKSTNLLVKYRKSNDESKKKENYVLKLLDEFCGSVLVTITLGFFLSLPIVIRIKEKMVITRCFSFTI